MKAFKAAQLSKWSFWTRYKKYLAEKKSFAPSVISHLDELTDKVLDKLFNPQQEDIVISKKGLVVGQVQSGKTANYTGLVCKAADAGFNLIIVLVGIHNNLRSQTQTRLDEGFWGLIHKIQERLPLIKPSKWALDVSPDLMMLLPIHIQLVLILAILQSDRLILLVLTFMYHSLSFW